MFPIPAIPWLYKAVGATVLVAALFLAHIFRVNAAYSEGKKDAMAAVAVADNQLLLLAKEKVAKLEKELAAEVNKGVLLRAEEKLNYASQLQDTLAKFSSGAERLRCPAVTVHTPTSTGNSGTAIGSTATQGGYLLPGTAADVLRIARSDYENVQQYNEVVRLYNEMKRACNAKR